MHIHDKSTSSFIRNGNANKEYTLYVWIDSAGNGDMKNPKTNSKLFTIKSQKAERSYYFNQILKINSQTRKDYYNSSDYKKFKNYIDNSNRYNPGLNDYLSGYAITGDCIKEYQLDSTHHIAISACLDKKDCTNLNISFMRFGCEAQNYSKEITDKYGHNTTENQLTVTIKLFDTNGMVIRQNKNNPVIETSNTIDQAYVNITDAKYQEAKNSEERYKELAKLLVNLGISIIGPDKSSIYKEIGNIGKGAATDKIIDELHTGLFNATHHDNGKKGIVIKTSLAFNKDCEMGKGDEGKFIEANCYAYNESLINNASINFLIVDSNGNKLPYSWNSN